MTAAGWVRDGQGDGCVAFGLVLGVLLQSGGDLHEGSAESRVDGRTAFRLIRVLGLLAHRCSLRPWVFLQFAVHPVFMGTMMCEHRTEQIGHRVATHGHVAAKAQRRRDDTSH
ncbi:hypothetical protein [Streptomyces sp. NPDC058671]|uniref:hypothetical protein n=1 Tax=Streptomyces sp. NPDC058671 TaxID=3346590 RepID=UPI003654F33A